MLRELDSTPPPSYPTPTSPPPEPLLISAKDLATLLRVSTRTLWRRLSLGELPRPIRFGGNTRWRLDEVRAWIARGCPPVGEDRPPQP